MSTNKGAIEHDDVSRNKPRVQVKKRQEINTPPETETSKQA